MARCGVSAQLGMFAAPGPEPTSEIWVSLAPFSDPPGALNYEVSSHGRIRSERGVRQLSTWRGTNRLKINLSSTVPCSAFGCRSHKSVGQHTHKLTVHVHVIVCMAFNGPRPEGYHCDHIDGDPSNNHAFNLRWVPASENHANKAWLRRSR